jgi:hypothetical protein
MMVPAVLIILGAVAWGLTNSEYRNRVNYYVEQPVPFSHRHHVSGLGIDCRFCHSGVEVSPTAGVPATKVCMTCHSQIWTNAPILQPVRDSWREGVPIAWVKVNDTPDFVYFDHSIHVNKGVGCVTCHGRVDEMPLMTRQQPLTMRWCLECHENPGPQLRPREMVFDMASNPPDRPADGARLAEQYHVAKRDANPHEGMLSTPNQLTNCSTCHH